MYNVLKSSAGVIGAMGEIFETDYSNYPRFERGKKTFTFLICSWHNIFTVKKVLLLINKFYKKIKY